MSKLNVIRFERTNDDEIHIYPPDSDDNWWARRVPKYVGDGHLWELRSDDDGDAEGFFEDVEPMMAYVSRQFDDAPVVEKRNEW